MPPPKPMLDGVELPLAQRSASEEEEVLAQHAVPGLEGDFLQDLGRRAVRITLSGVLTGPEAGEDLRKLREKYRAAEPVPFVSDIATATRVDEVLIEEIGVREVAGRPQRFEYALALREYTPPPAVTEEPPPVIPPPPLPVTTLVVEVVVEGEPDFDFSRVELTATRNGEQRTLATRSGNVWTEEDLPAGRYVVEAVVGPPEEMTATEQAAVREGETTQVTLTLRRGAAVARAFIVHFWFDKAFIEPCLREVLRRAAAYSDAHPDDKVLIVGHTDLVGSDDYNQSLSERRARSVYAYLTAGRGLDGHGLDAAVAEWDELRKRHTPGVTLHDTWSTRELQYMLQDLGFYAGNVDEDHGPATDAAVRAFQTDRGLEPDGALDDATWRALVRAYLAEDPLSVPEERFLPNAGDGCDGGVVRWLGCGEQDPVLNTEKAWRPNRRTEILFVRADAIPCEVAKPVTFDLTPPGPVAARWCLGPGDPHDRACFLTREAPREGRWLVRPAEDGRVQVRGTITFEDGTPVANAKFSLTAPDGEYLSSRADLDPPPDPSALPDLEEKQADPAPNLPPSRKQKGRPIPDRADEQGRFALRRQTPEGVYVLELQELVAPQVARSTEEPAGSGRGNVVCFRLDAAEAPPVEARDVAFGADAAAPAGGGKGGVVQQAPVPAAQVQPVVTPADPVVVVGRSNTEPERVPITLSASGRVRGGGTLTRSGDTGSVRLFTSRRGGGELAFDANDQVRLTSGQLNRRGGFTVFAESDTPTGTVGGYRLTLTLAPGSNPAVAAVTAVRVTLDVFTTREPSGTAPQALPQPPAAAPAAGTATDKWFLGGTVNVQDAANSQERVKLRIGTVEPRDFAGTLELRQVGLRGNAIGPAANLVRVFENETPTPGEAPAPTAVPATGLTFTGEDLFLEGVRASGAQRDLAFQLGVQGASADGDRVALTVGVGVALVQSSPQRAVVVKRPHTTLVRPTVTLRSTAPLARGRTGRLTVTATSGSVRLFDAAGAEITAAAGNDVFPGDQLTAGVQVAVEGVTPCTAADHVQLVVTLSPGSPAAGVPGSTRLTSVALTLDVARTRTVAGTDPVLMSAADKVGTGRFVHLQDPGFHHGRAKLVVQRVDPPSFACTLQLASLDAPNPRLELFSDEIAAAGQPVIADPFEILSGLLVPSGMTFFAEGRRVSGNLRDTGFALRLDGQEGDRVAMTVVRFGRLIADVPSTPARNVRLGNSPVPRHTLTRGTAAGSALVATDFDEELVFNPLARRPLVLIEGSVTAADPVDLSVEVEPAGVPVRWGVQRDTRPAPDGDGPEVVALSPRPVPTINPRPGDPLRATLRTDAVGSFYVRPFVDVDGNGRFDLGIDREPFINMKLVLVRVGGRVTAAAPGGAAVTTSTTNTSVAQPFNAALAPATPTSTTGVQARTGGFANPAVAGVRNNAVVVVVGGGRTGRRGLDLTYAGWINNVTGMEIFAEYLDAATGNRHRHTTVFAENKPGGPATGLAVFVPPGTTPVPAHPTIPVAAAAPAPLAFPVLDTSPFGNEGTGGNTASGTEGSATGTPPSLVPGPPPPPAAGTHRGIRRTDLAIGQAWQVQMWDSPAHPAFARHFFQPGDLVRFRYNLDFSCDLCFWTNISNTPAPTPDPACRLYSSVQSNTWRIRFEMTFAPPPAGGGAAPAGVAVVPLNITLARDGLPLRTATPVQTIGREVRFQIALRMVTFNAT